MTMANLCDGADLLDGIDLRPSSMIRLAMYFRRVRRAIFCRPPVYVDGLAVQLMLIDGYSWEEALRERGRQNCLKLIAWYEGEKW